jgi:hypothetical protein
VKMGPIRCPETSVNSYHTTPLISQKSADFNILLVFLSRVSLGAVSIPATLTGVVEHLLSLV